MTKMVSILGAGSWGTALALLIARNGHPVTLWGHHPEHMAQLQADRRNRRYLPDAEFPPNLRVTSELVEAVTGSDIVLICVPSHAFQDILFKIKPTLAPTTRIAWATKGLELKSGRFLHTIVEEVLGHQRPAAVLSGPTFAAEVASGKPAAMTVAANHADFATEMAELLHNRFFRAYTTDDMVGVQLGGAVKNVMAIAAGVADGLGYGANTRAALITRGLAEMMRLGLALGARAETLMGLAGVGDLILTCTDNQSRNRRFGLGLGQGLSRQEVRAQIGQEIEGATAVGIVYHLAQKLGVEMPITEQTYKILAEDLSPQDAVSNLLLREPKPESIIVSI